MKALFWSFIFACLALANAFADYGDDENECDPRGCYAPDCTCASNSNPLGLKIESVPQFVMLTFDDAVNAANIDFYRELLNPEPNKNPGGCHIAATFFVSHEYNDYYMLNELHRNGSEIAVHTITHISETEKWKNTDLNTWIQEASGLRDMINQFAEVPKNEIVGFRAPFLQTSGDTTFEMLKAEGFLYDSSLPNQIEDYPYWPFTFDYGLPHDCMIIPCPEKPVKGLWIVPMNSFFKERKLSEGNYQTLPCAMVDACLPHPENKEDTYQYLMDNFERFYDERVPFPVFLHESYLKNQGRRSGYLKFVNKLKEMSNVYITTIKEVIEYMKNPVPLSAYKQKYCVQDTSKNVPCKTAAKFCNYPKTDRGGPRVMYTCLDKCPKKYPWLGNTSGK